MLHALSTVPYALCPEIDAYVKDVLNAILLLTNLLINLFT